MKTIYIIILFGLLLILPGCMNTVYLFIINDSTETILLELKVFPGLLEEKRKDHFHLPTTYRVTSFDDYEDVLKNSDMNWLPAEKESFEFSDKSRTAFLRLKSKTAFLLYSGRGSIGNISYESIRIVKKFNKKNSNKKFNDEIFITTNFLFTFQKEMPGFIFKNSSVYYLLL